jgi:hypothetical protein
MSVRHNRSVRLAPSQTKMPLELEVPGDQHITVSYNSAGMVEVL